MGFFDDLKKKAMQVSETVAKAASTASDMASAAGKVVAESTSKVASAATDAFLSSREAIADFATLKVKGIIRGLDLDATLDALNKHQQKAGGDTAALVSFIHRLKEYSEDGVISSDEKSSLHSMAEDAGISEDEFNSMLRDKEE